VRACACARAARARNALRAGAFSAARSLRAVHAQRMRRTQQNAYVRSRVVLRCKRKSEREKERKTCARRNAHAVRVRTFPKCASSRHAAKRTANHAIGIETYVRHYIYARQRDRTDRSDPDPSWLRAGSEAR